MLIPSTLYPICLCRYVYESCESLQKKKKAEVPRRWRRDGRLVTIELAPLEEETGKCGDNWFVPFEALVRVFWFRVFVKTDNFLLARFTGAAYLVG